MSILTLTLTLLVIILANMKDNINSIIKSLYSATLSKDLNWTEKHVLDKQKRSYERSFKSISSNGTEYEIDVKFSLNNDKTKWDIESNPSLTIRNKSLPGGYLFVCDYTKQYDIVSLRDIIFDMYCSDMNPTIDIIVDILESINKEISLSNYRDSKINKLIN